MFSLGLFLVAALAAWQEYDTISQHLQQFSIAGIFSIAALALLDAFMAIRQPVLIVERQVPHSLAVNNWSHVELKIRHRFSLPVKIKLYDGIPDEILHQNMPATILLSPENYSRQRYQIKPLKRGPFMLDRCYVSVPSPLRLWDTRYRAATTSEIKVYPDFSKIAAYTILATDNHVSQIGIKRKPRRGEGLEFLQLRDYRVGDSLRQLDWNATSKRSKLISKEYQDERDQQIVMIVDSGRRMRAADDDLNHFDHSLNALLLVSYIALRQGDSVSVMSFGKSHRWIPPQKGSGKMKTILNGMYDLQAENCAPDYIAAAEKLSALQKKRSLVILVTNSRDEEVDELTMAVNQLRKRHVVLLANIRESVIDYLESKPIHSLDDALDYAGVHQYLATRRQVHQKIRDRGIYAIDCLASELAVRVANSYLEIKRAGVL